MSSPGDRIDELMADTGLDGVVVFALLICNGCGARVEIEAAQQDPPEGWVLGGHGENRDFCPRCSGYEDGLGP